MARILNCHSNLDLSTKFSVMYSKLCFDRLFKIYNGFGSRVINRSYRKVSNRIFLRENLYEKALEECKKAGDVMKEIANYQKQRYVVDPWIKRFFYDKGDNCYEAKVVITRNLFGTNTVQCNGKSRDLDENFALESKCVKEERKKPDCFKGEKEECPPKKPKCCKDEPVECGKKPQCFKDEKVICPVEKPDCCKFERVCQEEEEEIEEPKACGNEVIVPKMKSYVCKSRACEGGKSFVELRCNKKDDPAKKKDPCDKFKKDKKDDPCKKKEEKKDNPCKQDKKEDPCKKKKEDPCKKDKKEDPCKKDKKEDPCKKKDDPCKKKEDPCKKKEDPCKKDKKEDPCKKDKKEDPCKKDKKEDPCKKDKKEDPCKKKEDPCKKKEDPCKKKDDPCKKKDDPCKKKEDPCKKKDDPCKKKDDPCKKKEDPCKKDKKEDPCKKDKKEDPCKKKDDPCKKKDDPCKKKEDPCKKDKKEDPCKKDKKEDPCKKKKDDPCKKPEKKDDPCKKKGKPKCQEIHPAINGPCPANKSECTMAQMSEGDGDIFGQVCLQDPAKAEEVESYFGENYQNKQYYSYNKYGFYDLNVHLTSERNDQPSATNTKTK